MVDISFQHYTALSELVKSTIRYSYSQWIVQSEANRRSGICLLIGRAITLHGEDYEKLLSNKELGYWEACRIHETSGRGSLLTMMSLSDWNSMDVEERRMLVDTWRAEALIMEKANTPESEVTPW